MEKNKNDEVINRCKCCLEEIGLKGMWKEYYSEGEREIYGEMLTDCFALSWTQPSNLDAEYICDTCIARLRDALSFKKEILYTEHLHLERLKKEGEVSTIKQEEESEQEIETEYLNIDYLEETDTEREKPEIKIEVPILKDDTDEPIIQIEKAPRYTEEDLEKCLEAVRSKALSQSKASVVYNIPRRTISAAFARPTNAGSKTDKKKKQETKSESKKYSEELLYKKKVRARMFPEFENFGKDLGTLFDCSNATPIRCRGGIGYKCCFCPQEFPDSADLKKHTIDSHDSKTKKGLIKGKYTAAYVVKLDITSLQCTLCSTNMNMLEELIDHLITVHEKKMHRNIKNYILPFKFQGDELRCIICFSIFNKFKVLQEHMSTHFRNYVCDDCNAGFVTRLILLRHVKCHQIGSFPCGFCPKKYNTLRNQKAHERLVHVHGNMLNKCGYCNQKFDKFQKKEDHLVKVHGVKSTTFKCLACDKSFGTQRALRDHTKRDHLMERRHKCTFCDKKFYRPHELTEHMVKHTGVKKFQCEVCLKSYLRRSTLREHRRIHANDRRFKCEHCGQSFVQRCSWRGHMRSKHGEEV